MNTFGKIVLDKFLQDGKKYHDEKEAERNKERI